MPEILSGPQQRTYDAIFSHPMSHNVEWRDVRSMFKAFGGTEDEHNGNTRFSRNGHSLLLRPEGSQGDVDPSALIKIRHFLKASETDDGHARGSDRLLVVIDHHEARIFKSEGSGAVPEKIVPHDPHGYGKHVHNVHDAAKGQHHPVPKSYFEAVAKTLSGAGAILIFGTGSGGGSAMNELLDELHKRHSDVFERVIGYQVVDESHLTEDQLLAKAREFHADPLAATGSG